MKLRLLVLIADASLICLLSACAAPPKYDWGRYDRALYAYYKIPASEDALSQTLEALIKTADEKNGVVAPGLRAEYGYLLLQHGNVSDAVQEFQQEEQHWPESKVFMDHMIQAASSKRTTANGVQ